MTHTDYVAEIQLSYKVERQKPYSKHKIIQARDSVDYIRIWFEQNNFSIEYREYFGVVYLNRRHNILGFNLISVGGVNGTSADPKLVFQGALLTNASEIIIFHNHPSGNTEPSVAAADAASDAASDDAASDATADAATRIKSHKQTADICRKILTEEIMKLKTLNKINGHV